MLPEIDGIEVARKVREDGATIPILMLTARVETQDVVEGFDAGADDYLRKPFEIPELISRVSALLKRTGRAQGRQFEASGVRVDPDSRALRSKASRSSSPPRSSICWRIW